MSSEATQIVPEQIRESGVDLRRLITLTAAAITFFGIILIAVIAYAGWTANQTAIVRERTLVENALNRSLARNLDEQKSVAWWDDSITNLREGKLNYNFLDANFGVFLTETYRHDEVYILNQNDRPIYAFLKGERASPITYRRRQTELAAVVAGARGDAPAYLRHRPDLFAQAQTGYQSLKGGVQAAKWSGQIMSIGGKPAVVTAITIVPNVNMSLMPAKPKILVSLRFINQDFIADIGSSLLLPGLSLLDHPGVASGMASQPLYTDEGLIAGYLNWRSKTPGRTILTVILPMTFLGVLAAGILFGAMFRSMKRASTELALREARARYESKHDALSGLPNRAHFTERLSAFLSGEEEPHGALALAAYIDIDRFKDINDTLGHRAGDYLIKAVSARLDECLIPTDFLARFGGDEFAVLRLDANEDSSRDIAERVANAFQEPFALEGQLIRVTASVGLAAAWRCGETADELMRHADIALYRAKHLGRNQAVLFSADMAEEVEQRRAIELDLRDALRSDQLQLHYQPIVSCGSHSVVGVEALLRWRHPVRGDIGPSVFIPIAEDSGLMPALGEWILGQAMRDSVRWPGLEIAINLSPVQIRHMDLAETLQRLVDEHKVDPKRFVLEITEGVLLDANERSQKALTAARAMGFKTSLDDFGTGYSSLAYLCNFKFDKIKVDRSFVTGKSQSEIARTIIHAVATLGRGLGMSVIAEGVETEFDAVMVTHLGCTEMQGYHFSKPAPAAAIDAIIQSLGAAAIAEDAPGALKVLPFGA